MRRSDLSLTPLSLAGAAFFLALVPRLLLAIWFPGAGGDTPTYETVARNILEHGCVSVSDPRTGGCAPHWGGNQLPGYPAFIAAVWYLVGTGATGVAAVQTALNALAVSYLAYAVTLYAGSPRRAWLPTVVICLSPLTVPWSRFVVTEALTVAATHWILAEIVLSLHFRRLRALPLGAAFAVAVFLRHDNVFLLLPIGLSALHLHGARAAAAKLLAVCLIAALPLGAWWARSVAAGLAPMPDRYAGLDVPPKGYIAWGLGWTTHQYQFPGWLYPIYTKSYSKISIPNEAFDGEEDKARISALLARLARFDGRDFPADIDDAFAQAAQRRLHEHPVRQMLGRPLMRCAFYWFNPIDSNGWPVELDGARLAVARDFRAMLERAKEHIGAVSVKLASSAYRMTLLLACVALAARALRRRESEASILCWALSYALVQSVFHAAIAATEVRYILSAAAMLEFAVGLTLSAKLLAQPACARAGAL